MKSNASSESDVVQRSLQDGHIRTDESDGLPDRILSIMGGDSVSSWARKCGFGESTLRSYLTGADPSRKRLVTMAVQGNVSLEWLATGREPKARHAVSPPSGRSIDDKARLATAVRAVEEGLAAIGRTMLPEKRAELILAAYDLISQDSSPAQTAKIIQFIKLAA